MAWDRLAKRRVTREDFRAIDDILDECWDGTPKLPRWAAARIASIVRKGLSPKR